jgi:hypothetical protein
MSYSLGHIFKECIDLRESTGNSNSKKSKSREALELMFQESWFGINRWIESRLGIRMVFTLLFNSTYNSFYLIFLYYILI